MSIRNFRELEVWKLGRVIVTKVYQHTGEFPKSEIYGLTAQMRRSAISIPSNIAEGFNRFHNKEYKQFLYIALGSCAELETQLEISNDLEFIQERYKNELIEHVSHETGMLRNLIKKLWIN